MAIASEKKEASAWELCLHFPPFLVHVALVLIVGWISSCLNLNLPTVFTLGLAYLYFVQEKIKVKTESRIRSEERRANDRKRLLSDAETARWLNSTVEAVWPIFLENFASQKFLMGLAPWFLEKYKPWTAKRVVLQQIRLGRCPPVFSMLRCGSNPTDGDHLVLEMDMKFVAARDMSAIIAVQLRKRVGLGIWTSLNISNIQIEGKLRVGVRFTRGWPVVERLRVCFSKAPILRMTAKPIMNYGIDVTDLPGIASWIDAMIAQALEESLVEPNVLEVEVEKLVGSMMAVNSQLPTASKHGPWFAVRNPKVPLVATLKVEILKGKKLKPSDPNGKADPYVKLRFGSVKHVTSIKYKTLQPEWYETYEFPVESGGLHNKLLLRVRDKDKFGHDDEMGYKEIDCKEFNAGERYEMWVTLDEVKTGELRIAITVEKVPVVEHATDLTKSSGRLESENANSEIPSARDKDKKSWIESSERHDNDEESSDWDSDENLLQSKREALDVGYGHFGAVSIVTPGKAEVKEASNPERLRRRRNSASTKVEVNGDGRSTNYTEPLSVSTPGKRSRLKKLWKNKKHSSQSDSSGELRIGAEGENNTELDMTVETDGERYKVVIQPDNTPSSCELQRGTEGQSPDESKAETRGMNKVHSFMHRMGKRAHIVSSAISKMSQSKKRSHSDKNLGENPVDVDQVETHMPEESTSTMGSTGDEVFQAENTSVNKSQADALNDDESGKGIHESEAETGKFSITRDIFVPRAPSTPSDQAFSSVVHLPPRTDGDHCYPDSVPTAISTISEKNPPASPVNAALSHSCGSGHSSAKDFIVVKWPRRVDLDHGDKDAVSSSIQVVRNSDEVQVTASRTFPEDSTDGSSQSSATKTLGSHTEAGQRAVQEQLVEQQTILDQEIAISQRSPEEESNQHVLSDGAVLTD